MRFAEPLIAGRFVRRYQRFLADFVLADGQQVVAHCANPGSMLTCLQPGARAWLSRRPDPRRKLRFTWEIAEVGRARIYVNPVRSNHLVAEAVEAGWVPELAGYDRLRREVRVGSSRIDLLLEREEQRCYVEVKSATLRLGPRLAGFPDAVTERGRRHLDELVRLVGAGHRAVLFFTVNRTDAHAMAPADGIDPLYGATLRYALQAGVEVLAYRTRISPRGVKIDHSVPFRIQPG